MEVNLLDSRQVVIDFPSFDQYVFLRGWLVELWNPGSLNPYVAETKPSITQVYWQQQNMFLLLVGFYDLPGLAVGLL